MSPPPPPVDMNLDSLATTTTPTKSLAPMRSDLLESADARTGADNPEEAQYLALVRNVMGGAPRLDRTQTGTLSVFAPRPLVFNLENGVFPLFTTKRVPLRAVFEELMWFLRGCTDSSVLAKKHIHIWDANGSREALDRAGLVNNAVGDLGPVYGFQWRHFGAEYRGPHADYSGQGVDQVRDVIDKIKNDPMNRRILISAWNPAELKNVALPPCHLLCQFYVSTPTDEQPVPKLSCQLYQRSADLGLGVPFNVSSYALLTILIAYVTGLHPGTLTVVLGDAHVYRDHIAGLTTQLARTPRAFPSLHVCRHGDDSCCDRQSAAAMDEEAAVREEIRRQTAAEEARERRRAWSVDAALDALLRMEFDCIRLNGYEPYPKIPMQMSV
ncbi:Thymidylate synthase [Entophlyctis luteolus]|nr:Thymidylate synthase [Entophlyctis luteolus]